MRLRAPITVVVVIAVAGAAFLLMREKASAPVAMPEGERMTTTTTDAAAASDVDWTFVPADDDPASGAPRTAVTVRIAGREHEVGTYQGSCALRQDDLLPGEKSAVLCWFAGGGTELGVFEEDGGLVVKAGTVDEGSAEEAGFRGDFRTVVRL